MELAPICILCPWPADRLVEPQPGLSVEADELVGVVIPHKFVSSPPDVDGLAPHEMDALMFVMALET